jgi:uncharacterized Fe-S cluster protein YjdI
MQEYKNDKLAVRYDPKVCIHAGECVRGLPSVFDVSKKPWIGRFAIAALTCIVLAGIITRALGLW